MDALVSIFDFVVYDIVAWSPINCFICPIGCCILYRIDHRLGSALERLSTVDLPRHDCLANGLFTGGWSSLIGFHISRIAAHSRNCTNMVAICTVLHLDNG
jgi:hypothetical protein